MTATITTSSHGKQDVEFWKVWRSIHCKFIEPSSPQCLYTRRNTVTYPTRVDAQVVQIDVVDRLVNVPAKNQFLCVARRYVDPPIRWVGLDIICKCAYTYSSTFCLELAMCIHLPLHPRTGEKVPTCSISNPTKTNLCPQSIFE